MNCYTATFSLPCTTLGIRTDANFLVGIDFLCITTQQIAPRNKLAEQVCLQLQQYQENPSHAFILPILLRGTPFQNKVWQALQNIPHGSTKTYRNLARELRTSPRAIGGACGRNPIAVIIPCHRVVASKGLGGFMQGARENSLAIKRWLLQHENASHNY